MKLLGLLIILAFVQLDAKGHRRQRFTFAEFGDDLLEMKDQMDMWIATVLDESSESGLIGEWNMIMNQIEEGVCFDTETYSETCSEDLFFGCHCMNAFNRQAGQCSQVPCKAVRHIKDNAGAILRRFRDEVMSFQDYTELMVEMLYTPFFDMTCPCLPSLIDATFECINNYDAAFIKDYEDVYQVALSLIDMDTVERIVDTVMTVYCMEAGGEQCYHRFGEVMTTYSEMIDNSFDETHEDECSSWVRIERSMARYMHLVMTTKSQGRLRREANRVIEVALCDPMCQEEMADSFYSCCAKKALPIIKERSLSKDIDTLMENIRFVVEQFVEMPDDGANTNDNGILQQVSMDFNPEKECSSKDGRNFYAEAVEGCDLEA